MELVGIGTTELPANIDCHQSWFRSGFPNALLANSANASREWLNALIRSYTEWDLGHLFGVDLISTTLRNFWSMLTHVIGNIWNAEAFARSVCMSAPTIVRYRSFLEGGYLVRCLQPWFVNAKKRLVVWLLSGDFFRLVVLAALIAFPLSWWAMSQWLNGFAYHITMTPVYFLLSGGIVLLMTGLTTGYQAIKTALGNPVNTLRSE